VQDQWIFIGREDGKVYAKMPVCRFPETGDDRWSWQRCRADVKVWINAEGER
jgi:hypothetical protein